MNPAYWLLIVLVAMAAAIFFVAWIAYQLGYDAGHDDAAPDTPPDLGRHRHRHGDPTVTALLELPKAGRLEPLPMPPTHSEWMFFGGAQVEPQPGAAEYRLMIEQATAPDPDAETPSAFTRRMAAEVEAMIKGWEEQGNYDRHTMRASG